MAASREFLAPTAPPWDHSAFTPAGQERLIEDLRSQHDAGRLWPGVIVAGKRVVGRITLNAILRGLLKTCFMGYWVGRDWNGRGIATTAVARTLEVAFDSLGLHRVEAFTHLDNAASRRVLEKNDFTLVGVLRRHIHQAGAWRDEYLFERLAWWDDGRSFSPGEQR